MPTNIHIMLDYTDRHVQVCNSTTLFTTFTKTKTFYYYYYYHIRPWIALGVIYSSTKLHSTEIKSWALAEEYWLGEPILVPWMQPQTFHYESEEVDRINSLPQKIGIGDCNSFFLCSTHFIWYKYRISLNYYLLSAW